MKKNNFLIVIRLILVSVVLLGGLYSLVVLAIAQFSKGKGEGQTITVNGKVHFAEIAEKFTADKYFWPRPSAANYNAAASSGSNSAPTNPDYLNTVRGRLDSFLVHNPGIKPQDVPSDLLTASGSGLDPDISVDAALVQVKRISRQRHLAESDIRSLVLAQTSKSIFKGPAHVNVLKLNIALDLLK